MKTIAKFSAEIPTGIQPSRGIDKIDLWEDGDNIIFQEGSVQPAPGQFLILPKPETAPVVGLCEARFSDGTRNIFLGTATKLWHWQEFAAAAVDVTHLAGAYTGNIHAVYAPLIPSWAPATLWSMVSWGDTIFATNGVDEVQKFQYGVDTEFDDMSNFSDLPSTFRAHILGKIGPFLLMFGRWDTTGPTYDQFTLQWCDEDDPAVWVAVVANAAGELEARDLGSPIIAASPFASGYAVYGNDECRYLEFVGAPDYFGLRPLLNGIGALSKNAVVAVERIQFGMSNRGIWVHDGSQSKFIDTPDVHDYIYDSMNQYQVSKCVAAYDPVEQLVMFFWPSGASNIIDRGAAFNRTNGTWTKLSFARTAYTPGHVWEGGLTGSTEGDVFMHSGPGFMPTGQGGPLSLIAKMNMVGLGYGQGGYGMFYYGGRTVDEGEPA